MGYTTFYNLTIARNCDLRPVDDALRNALIAEFRVDNPDALYCLDSTGHSDEAGKWYGHEADLADFSKAHPDFVFTLSGEGESSGDIWKKYFLNGKIQREKAQVIVLPLDRGKLERFVGPAKASLR